jgi:molybdopterin-binding protein
LSVSEGKQPPLEELIFHAQADEATADRGLAEVISAWYRQARAQSGHTEPPAGTTAAVQGAGEPRRDSGEWSAPGQLAKIMPFARPSAGAAMLSARNQLKGTVKSVKLGDLMAEVVVAVGGQEIVSVITRTSAEHLGLKAGDAVTAIIKSTEVMIARD